MNRPIGQKALFDERAEWVANPREAFASFVQAPEFLQLSRRPLSEEELEELGPIRASSARIYILMFGKFLSWLERERPGKTLYQVAPADLLAFLGNGRAEARKAADKPLASSIKIRYVRLLERVFTHLNVTPNPARDASMNIFRAKRTDKKAAGSDLPTQFLSDAEQARFMRALPSAPPAGPGAEPTEGWRDRRNRAMLALMLGAGLKVSEVLGIETSSIGTPDSTGSVRVTVTPSSTDGTSERHRSQLRPFAAPEVLSWARERRRLNIPGDLLFPSTKSGKRLNKTSLYLAVKETLVRAGIEVDRQGGRTLRNSFAIRELKTESVELVGEFLGHRIRKSTELYEKAAAAAHRRNSSDLFEDK